MRAYWKIHGERDRERGINYHLWKHLAEKSPIKLQECFYAGHVCKWITPDVT